MTNAPTTPDALDDLAGEVRARDTLVVDTSVLLADPACLTAFPGTDIVIPLTVLEELDGHKTRQDQIGAHARTAIRDLESYRVAIGGDPTAPSPLGEDATVRVEPNGLRLEELRRFHLPTDNPDHKILAAALGLQHDGRTVTVVTGDAAMRLKAATLGLAAADYEVNNAPFTTADKPGWATVEVTVDLVDDLYRSGFVALDDLGEHDGDALAALVVNEFADLKAGRQTVLVRRTGDGLRKVAPAERTKSWGLRSRNKEQQFALELLRDPEVEVVALSGRAGTGKTIVAIAAALQQTFESGDDGSRYDRIMILRPMYAIGKQDIGFLPGEVEDKIGPWFDAIVDAMVALSTTGMEHKEARDLLDLWVEQGKLTMEPVTFLRGRSLSRTVILADEVQNLEPAVVRTVLTRIGQGSKIVVCGDTQQCDNPWTTPTNNGLTALVAAFRGQSLFGHVALTACERSRVADLAAELL